MGIIKVDNLQKKYRVNKRGKGLLNAVKSVLIPEYEQITAVNNISFSIERGSSVGFIGPNGAGKSTTIKMLTGILAPSSGSILVNGICPFKDRKKNAAQIGVIFGQRTQLWWDLPVIDTFDLLKHIYKVPETLYKQNMEFYNDILDLSSFYKQPVRQLSLGQRMRADIAAALLHNPEIVFFDEPTIGLDLVAKDKIRDFIRLINREREATILFTTHDLVDIEKTCERLVVIDKGQIIHEGSMSDLKNSFSQDKVLIAELEDFDDKLSIAGVEVIKRENRHVWLKFNKEQIAASTLISMINRKYSVLDLSIQDSDIEDIIKDIYKQGETYEDLSRVC